MSVTKVLRQSVTAPKLTIPMVTSTRASLVEVRRATMGDMMTASTP